MIREEKKNAAMHIISSYVRSTRIKMQRTTEQEEAKNKKYKIKNKSESKN